jgi:hypothetical protein
MILRKLQTGGSLVPVFLRGGNHFHASTQP